MEQNMQIIAKKCWNIVRILYYMLRKGISKAKLFSDLNLMMKRGKIAGKSAIYNLMFHHHAATAASSRQYAFPAGKGEYEFRCPDSPAYPAFHFHFPTFHKRKHSPPSPAPMPPIDPDMMAAALEVFTSAASSPALPGFVKPSPMVRQLRITDSPFPIGGDADLDSGVDAAAEEFIMKFYNELKRQNGVAYLGYN